MAALGCARDDCDRPVAVAIRTSSGGIRGINSTLYYELQNPPPGAELLCADHGTELVGQLMRVLAGE